MIADLLCPRSQISFGNALLLPAKFHFALMFPSTRMGSAMKLPPQARSQVKLGNEEEKEKK